MRFEGEVGPMDINLILGVVALVGGIATLIYADLLNYIVAVFLIGFGVIQLAPMVGVDLGVTTAELQAQIEALESGSSN